MIRPNNKKDMSDVSRTELLQWVNFHLGTTYKKIEDCSSGVAFVSLLGMATEHPINRLKTMASTEQEFIHNFKLLQELLTKQGIQKTIEIDKLVKGNFQLNLELLQWTKRYCESKGTLVGYTPAAVVPPLPAVPASGPKTPKKTVGAGGIQTPGKTTRTKSPMLRGPSLSDNTIRSLSEVTAATTVQHHPRSASCTPAHVAAPPPVITPAAATGASSGPSLEKMERDFYFDKLRDIEILIEDSSYIATLKTPQLVEEVRKILYKAGGIV